jgi:hypothetical protein
MIVNFLRRRQQNNFKMKNSGWYYFHLKNVNVKEHEPLNAAKNYFGIQNS